MWSLAPEKARTQGKPVFRRAPHEALPRGLTLEVALIVWALVDLPRDFQCEEPVALPNAFVAK